MEPTITIGPDDWRALLDLEDGDADLNALETLVNQFNIFEALEVTRRELTHSNVLAFLLDPRQNHGLGDSFLKSVLQGILANTSAEPGITPSDLALWPLTSVDIRREWQFIDLLIFDREHNFVVVIENKIGTSEHSNQLQHYRSVAEGHFPNSTRLFVYLTPDGAEPSDVFYIPVDYSLIADSVESLITTSALTLDPGVKLLMGHYVRMLRRHVVADSDIAELCRRIYAKHGRALDILFEHRPDRQADIRALLFEIIDKTPGIIRDTSVKQHIRFALLEWDDNSRIPPGAGWTRSGRMLLFVFANLPTGLQLALWIGPGDETDRSRLLDRAKRYGSPFGPDFPTESPRFIRLYARNFLDQTEFEEARWEEASHKIRHQWNSFLNEDLPTLRGVILGSDEEV